MGRKRLYEDGERVSLRLPKKTLDQLDAFAESLGVPRNEVVVRALAAFGPSYQPQSKVTPKSVSAPKPAPTHVLPDNGADKQAVLDDLRRRMAQPQRGLKYRGTTASGS